MWHATNGIPLPNNLVFHHLQNIIIFLSSLLDGFTPFVQGLAKCHAKESDLMFFIPVFAHYSNAGLVILSSFDVCFQYRICQTIGKLLCTPCTSSCSHQKLQSPSIFIILLQLHSQSMKSCKTIPSISFK